MHATTILAVRKDGKLALGGDGQVTVGDTVLKSNANKVRSLKGGKVLAGFAGSVADAITLFEKFEEKLDRYPGNLPRASVELAKDWRSDRVLRRLEALLIVADLEHVFLLSGSGELIEAGRRAFWRWGRGAAMRSPPPGRSIPIRRSPRRDVVRRALEIAADICIYTNRNLTILELGDK